MDNHKDRGSTQKQRHKTRISQIIITYPHLSPNNNTMLRLLFLSAALWVSTTTAWSSQYSSSFGGRSVTGSGVIQNGSTLDMKKGKPNVPPNMRGQYKKQQEMAQMREQMVSASKPGEDGLPVFNLFVRSSKGIWYPCGSFKGDERSAALAKSYADGGWLEGISKKQLDGGIAGSLYSDLNRLEETVGRAYPQLRKSRANLEYGYKLAFPGLSEEKAKEIVPVEPKEQGGPLDGLRNIFS